MTIQDMRKERGFTQDQVAAKLGVKQAYYSRVERGIANPTLSKLRRLAKIYGVTVPEIVAAIPEPPRGRRGVTRTLVVPLLDGLADAA